MANVKTQLDAAAIEGTDCFTDLGKLNLLMVVRFQAQADSRYCPSCLKNEARFESSQNGLKNNNLSFVDLNR